MSRLRQAGDESPIEGEFEYLVLKAGRSSQRQNRCATQNQGWFSRLPAGRQSYNCRHGTTCYQPPNSPIDNAETELRAQGGASFCSRVWSC
jgi:hypothetical protein